MKWTSMALTLIWLTLGLSAQQAAFRASTSLVRLEVSVTDEHGPVQGLTVDDFEVEDRGQRQTVNVDESTDLPLDLVLVAQPLPSVAHISPNQAPVVRAGLSAFLDQVQDRDRLAAIAASAPTIRLRPLDFGHPSIGAESFGSGNYAAPFDAIAAGLQEFDSAPRRKALVAFTNAADFRSTTTFDELTRLVTRLGPALVLVGTPVDVFEQTYNSAAIRQGALTRQVGDTVVGTVSGTVFPAALRDLARKTGGIAVNLGTGRPSDVVESLFLWLRTRYVVSYKPPAGEGWHPVSVKVKRKGATVIVREGYFLE